MLTPFGVRRVGIRHFLLAGFVADIILFLAMKIFDSIGAWFLLRMLLGLVGSALFTASEAWINLLAGDANRGRIIGIYAAALSAGFGLGPLLLSVTGITGWAPFLANTIIVAIAMLPLLGAADIANDLGRDGGANPLVLFFRAKLIVAVVAMFGFFETALLALLPIWGVRSGLTVPEASALVSAVYVGAVALQVPIGIVSDKTRRIVALRICGMVGVAGAAILVAARPPLTALYPILFVWGGIVSGIYPIALGMAGDRFTGSTMVAANAAIIMSYGLGTLVGPALGGFAMDLWNPQGLLGMFVALFGILLVMSLTVSRN